MAQRKYNNNKKSRILQIKCAYCDKFISVKQYRLNKKYQNYFCDKICYGKFQRRRKTIRCQICHRKKEITLSHYKRNARCCSRTCHFIYQSLREYKKDKEHHCFKTGEVKTKRGYIMILRHSHPFRDKNNRVGKHRLIIERKIGRYLKKNEVVHHKNQNPSDNRLKNLQLMTKSEHTKLHNKLNKK